MTFTECQETASGKERREWGEWGRGLTRTRLSSAATQKAREAIPKLPMTTMAGCCGSGARTLGSARLAMAGGAERLAQRDSPSLDAWL